MTHEEWKRVDALFARLIDLPPEQQRKELEKACEGNPALFDYVDALLKADPSPPSILEASLEELTELVGPSTETENTEFVNAYRLTRKIGEGGMGVVFEAERADGQFEQRVAVKRIKRGMDTVEIVRRFRYERQILASLEHPNIARLLDGGVNDDRPYFVMEFVEGKPITDYADDLRLDIDARLALFSSVCSAVQHAHQRLVVHRDLKPSNILVTPSNEVKLLDFGIAKLLSEDPIAHGAGVPISAIETKTGRQVLTPAYASPEQLNGEAVTTASDVYSLGVVLYELLTGQRPFEKRDAETSNTSATRPSTAISKNTDRKPSTIDEISQKRSSTSVQLQRRLRGDLDTIVLEALQPEAERRYQSAEQFLDDIKRHLAGLPVQARPDTFGYRTGKFLRRHKLPVTLAVAIVALLLGFAVLMAYQQRQTALERDTAEEVAGFLESMFDASDPFAEERLDTLRVNALIQRGAAQIEKSLEDQPLVQARMQHIIGRVSGRLGMHDEALPLLEQALETRRTLLGDDHLDVAETLIERGDLLYAEGEYERSEASFREALGIRRATFSEDHPLVAEAMSKRGQAQHALGKLDEADASFRSALAIQQQVLGDEHAEVATTMSTLASLLEDRGEYAEAESLHTASLAMRRNLYGRQHPTIAVGLKNLAIFLRSMNRYEDAEPFLREAIDIDRAILAPRHPNLITDLNILASILRSKGDYEGAEAIFEEVLAARREVLGSDHPDVSITLDSYARVLKDKGDYAGAERLQREAIAIARKAYGDRHMSIAVTTGSLASILRAAGQPERALPAYREALDLFEEFFSPEHPNAAVLRSNLAGCLTDLGQYAEAESLLLKSYDVLLSAYDQEHRLTQSTIRYLVTLYEAWGRSEPAERYQAMVYSG